MTSISAAFLSSLSGLRAAQAGLAVASQNIANASTPGYVRSELTLAPNPSLGAGGGVEIAGVRRAADQFLAYASQLAESARGAASARADFLDRVQSSFGDPAAGPNVFTALDDFWSAISGASVDPTSSVSRNQALSALQSMFSELNRISGVVQNLTAEADARIADKVSEAQDIINQVSALNREISLNRRSGADVTGAENAQGALLDKLSALMDLRVSAAPDGGVFVRTTAGALLVGVEPAQISYTATEAQFASHDFIRLNPQLGAQTNLEPMLTSGEIKGLLDVRDRDLAGLAQALGGFAGVLGDALNRVHNEGSAVPPPTQLIGRQTGLLAADSLGFTGQVGLGIVDSQGQLTQRLAIDFDAGTITGAAPAATYNFGPTIGSFVTALNTALGAATPAGSATFANGVLSLSVPSGGIAVDQNDSNPSQRAGRGFSHFFGLNDLVSRPTPMFFENGISGSDAHGFVSGGALSYEIRDSGGRLVAQRSVTISGPLAAGGSTMNNLVSALNTAGTGVGEFATFALDPATGQVRMTANPGYQVNLIGDTTIRGATGISFSALNGLSAASTAGRATDLAVSSRLMSNGGLLAIGQADLSVALGQRVVEGGDSRNASAMAAVRSTVVNFGGGGGLAAQAISISNLAARLGGEAGRQAAEASRAADGAQSVASAAADRRSKTEGVTLDEELLKMTTYQNSYAAAARVIQAASEMLDILMGLGLHR